MKCYVRSLASIVFAVMVVCCSIVLARAQVGDTGVILGTVTDQTAAVIPGADVVITNTATNIRTSVKTDQYGNFYLQNVAIPGPYRLAVDAAGFRGFVREGIVLDLDQRLRVDPQLTVGVTTETTTVTGEIAPMQTDSGSVGHVMDNTNILSLPLLQRVGFDLNNLLPGVSYQTYPAATLWGSGDIARFNGGQGSANEIQIDGIVNESSRGGYASYYPNVDSIQELKVLSAAYSAEYGGSAGGVILATLKGGTNSFHGTLFEFLRNDAMNARNFFLNPNQAKQEFKQNRFGESLGGPIRKNKLFFFEDWEAIRNRQAAVNTSSVPTDAERAGNFSSSVFPVIYDPATTVVSSTGTVQRTPFPGNIISPNRLDPAALNVVAYYPEPNVPGGGIANNYTLDAPGRLRTDQADLRMDYYLSDRLKLMGHESVFDFFQKYSPNYTTVADTSAGLTRKRRQNGGVNLVYTLSPTMTNEFKVGFNRELMRVVGYSQDGNYPQKLGINNVPQTVFPTFVIAGLSNVGDGGANSVSLRRATYYQMGDTFSIIRGRHYIKIGTDIRRQIESNFQPSMPSGQFSFAANQTGLGVANTGLGMASFIMGLGNSASISLGAFNYMIAPNYSVFVQDDFRVSSRLTLNLGLRWEPTFNFHEKYNRLSWFDPNVGHIVFAGQGGEPTTIYPTEYRNFAPRLGLAYNLPDKWKTVVRAGYGIDWTNPTLVDNPGTAMEQPYPWGGSRTTAPLALPTNAAYQLSQFQGFAPLVTVDQCMASSSTCATSASLIFYDQKAKMPYMQSWNFSVQRALTSTIALDVAYVGTKGDHLYTGGDSLLQLPLQLLGPNSQFGGLTPAQRSPFPTFSSISIGTFAGGSTYQSLQVRGDKRLSRDVAFGVSYTWSKCLENTGAAENRFNRAAEKHLCTDDTGQRLVNTFVYRFPWGPGRRYFNGPGVLPKILGGWETDGTFSLIGGKPFSVTVTPNTASANGGGTMRANRVLGVSGNLPRDQRTLQEFFNIAAFTAPAPYTFGNSAPDILWGPGFVNLDLVLAKIFTVLRERVKVDFRAEAYDALNTPFFGFPGSTLGAAGFGTISSALNSRVMQMALKVIF